MFEKILLELKNKYKDLGLSENILKAYAKKLAKAVKEESEIESAVEDVEDDLRIYQSLADQNRTLKREIEALTKTEGGEKKPEEEKPKEEEKKEDPMLEILKQLKDEIAGIKSEKINQTNAQKLTAKLQELGVKENFYKHQITGKTFENDDQITDFATALKTDYDALIQDITNKDLEKTAGKSFGSGEGTGEKVSADVENYIKSKFKTNETN